jgi:hypothetical protein
MFRVAAMAERAERDGNPLAGFLLWDYSLEIAVWLCGDGGLQDRLRFWFRGLPRLKVGYRSRRPPRRRRKPSGARRRTRAIDIPGVYR